VDLPRRGEPEISRLVRGRVSDLAGEDLGHLLGQRTRLGRCRASAVGLPLRRAAVLSLATGLARDLADGPADAADELIEIADGLSGALADVAVELDLAEPHSGAGVELNELTGLGQHGEVRPQVVELELDLVDLDDRRVDVDVDCLFDLLGIGDREVRQIGVGALGARRRPAGGAVGALRLRIGPSSAAGAVRARSAVRARRHHVLLLDLSGGPSTRTTRGRDFERLGG
jgi:hypothetical protein